MKRYLMHPRLAIFLGLLACMSCQMGCRAKGPPTGSISGKVTYKGQPLTTGVVTLINEKTGSGASSEIDASGGYRITLIRTGEFNVAIQQKSPPRDGDFVTKGKQKLNIPDKYQTPETSGLTATVKEGSNTADFGL